jgi:hypothetical protein
MVLNSLSKRLFLGKQLWSALQTVASFLLFLFYAPNLIALPKDIKTDELFVYSLEEEWTVFDKSTNTYLPYFANLYPKVNKLHVEIDKPIYKGLYINILGDSTAALFINQRLCYLFTSKKWFSMSIDSLQKRNKDKTLLLTYYKTSNFGKQPEVYLTVNPYKQLTQARQEAKQIRNLPHKTEVARKNMIGITSLLVLVVVALTSSLHTPLFKWSLLVKNFTNFIQARTQIKRLQGSQFFWYTVYYSLTIGFVISLIINKTTTLDEYSQLDALPTIWKSTSNFMFVFLLIVAGVLAKYVLVWLMAQLYNNRQILNLHFQEFIIISQIICSVILLLALVISTLPSHHSYAVILLKYIVLGFLAMQTFLISYRIKQSISYSWVYFFAYLFTTEIAPFLLYVKLFVTL